MLQSIQEEASNDSNASSDVIFLGEKLPSKELQEKAIRLKLPPHFYNYLEEDEDEKESEESEDSEETSETSQEEEVKQEGWYIFYCIIKSF